MKIKHLVKHVVKHLVNIIKFFMMFIFQLLVTVLGIFLIPMFMFRQESFECEHKDSLPNKRFKDKFFDNIFGNTEDGNLGDKPYKQKFSKLTFLTNYNWCAFRNPVHNLALKMGVNEVITDYKWVGNRYTEDRIGREGFVYSTATGKSGKKYDMYRWCKLFFKNYGIEMNIGYKNFNIQDLNKHYRYSFTVSINPFKKFEPYRELKL